MTKRRSSLVIAAAALAGLATPLSAQGQARSGYAEAGVTVPLLSELYGGVAVTVPLGRHGMLYGGAEVGGSTWRGGYPDMYGVHPAGIGAWREDEKAWRKYEREMAKLARKQERAYLKALRDQEKAWRKYERRVAKLARERERDYLKSVREREKAYREYERELAKWERKRAKKAGKRRF